MSKKSLSFLEVVKERTKVINPDIKFGSIIGIVDLIDIVENHPSIWVI